MGSKVTSTALGAELHGLVPAAKALDVLHGLPKHRVQACALKNMRLRVGTYENHRIRSLCTCCRFFDTDECDFQPNHFGRTSPQGPCAWCPSALSIASWSSSMSSSTSVMVSLTSMAEARAWLNESMDQLYKDPSKMETNYDMLQKSQLTT